MQAHGPAHETAMTTTKKTEVDERAASVTWNPVTGGTKTSFASPALLDEELYLARLARTGNRYPGQRNYHNRTFITSTGEHVWCESLTERRFLLSLDYTQSVVALAAQPMTMTFSDGTQHFPDFIALHADERQVVYNVKPARYITEAVKTQFANASELCHLVGWSHVVASEFDTPKMKNIEWLANFRSHLLAPVPGLREDLLAAAVHARTVGELAEVVNSTGNVVPAILNLAWDREIELDMSFPLSTSTLIRKAA